MAADDPCRIIWLHVRIRSLSNIYPIYSSARCQHFEWTHFGSAARARFQSCGGAALADDLWIWGGIIARSGSVYAKRASHRL